MANTGIDWLNYVRIQNGFVDIRSSTYGGWGESQRFTLDEAEDLADYIKAQVDKARRESPEVQQLTEDIDDIDSNYDAPVELALALVKRGYRKQ